MKLISIFTLLLMLGVSACAHNPRPESPEQRAQQQAQSLQDQNQPSGQPRSVTFRDEHSNNNEDAEQHTTASAEEQPAQPPVSSSLHQQSATLRGMNRSVTMPVVTSVPGGILR